MQFKSSPQSPWVFRLLVVVATLLSILVVQNIQFQYNSASLTSTGNLQSVTTPTSHSHTLVGSNNLQPNYILMKSPENKPSVKTTPEEEAAIVRKRDIYGGKGDKAHLGTLFLHKLVEFLIQLCNRRVYSKRSTGVI